MKNFTESINCQFCLNRFNTDRKNRTVTCFDPFSLQVVMWSASPYKLTCFSDAMEKPIIWPLFHWNQLLAYNRQGGHKAAF